MIILQHKTLKKCRDSPSLNNQNTQVQKISETNFI